MDWAFTRVKSHVIASEKPLFENTVSRELSTSENPGPKEASLVGGTS
jgi:hypothetical protein